MHFMLSGINTDMATVLGLSFSCFTNTLTSTHTHRLKYPHRIQMSAFTILEMNRSKDIQRLDDPAHTWHTCYASVKEGALRVWPLVNKFVARHIGDSGMPAEVFIATGSRTLMQYLFKPFSNAMARSFIED